MSRAESIAKTPRFADGDLHIKLSADTKLEILVSREAVMKACPQLEPALRVATLNERASWDKSVKVDMPSEKEPRQVFSLAQKYSDNTMLLEGQDFQGVPDGAECVTFDHSDLVVEKPQHAWVVEQGSLSHERAAASQYQVLIKIILGLDFHLRDLEPWNEHSHMDRYLDLIEELLARAQWHGCFPLIANAVAQKLIRYDSLWEAVAKDPRRLLVLAIKLRSAEIYFDALRHLMASMFDRKVSSSSAFLTKHTLKMVPMLISMARSMLVEQADNINELRLRLCAMRMFNPSRYAQKNILGQICTTPPPRKNEKRSMQIPLLARPGASIWSRLMLSCTSGILHTSIPMLRVQTPLRTSSKTLSKPLQREIQQSSSARARLAILPTEMVWPRLHSSHPSSAHQDSRNCRYFHQACIQGGGEEGRWQDYVIPPCARRQK